MKRSVMVLVMVAVLALSLWNLSMAQPAPPKPGLELPQGYFDRIAQDRHAFQFEKAWIEKTRRARVAREAFLAAGPILGSDMYANLPDAFRSQFMVAGTVYVPVIPIYYTNVAAPFTNTQLENQIFNGPTTSTGTLPALYSEMSYGALNVVGNVFPWVAASNVDTYYESGCNGLCGAAKTGQLILEALQGTDGSVDFGLYDNDGPDGLPNSGDDDGFVDFIAIVHPEIGGECGNFNMWSHRYVVGAWPEFFGAPWTSNDPRTGGGFIRIWDYTIQPAQGAAGGCGAGIIDIGVYAHEFGHAFGLPDLYDTDGGGQGIGTHGLMGSGNWQTPANPKHMSAWSKLQLGWLAATQVAPTPQAYNIKNIETNQEVYQMGVYEDRFSRKTLDAISGSYSMHCGLDPAAAAARNWGGSKGYGNMWDEAVRRTFGYDNNDPVTLVYDVAWDCEGGYDYGYLDIEVNGVTSNLATYTGTGSASSVNINLTPYVTGSGATSYNLIFRFQSDQSWSNEDNLWPTVTTALRFDNLSVNGGGESYFTDFESQEDGWCGRDQWPGGSPSEYFLVENRNPAGAVFDQFLWSPGLYIWHIDTSDNTGGTSGTTNLRPAGVRLMEADGFKHLLLGANWGDAGDPYPGSSNNTSFTAVSNPNNLSNSGNPTTANVTGIPAAAATMTATMVGGRFPPTISSITPNTSPQDVPVSITDLAGGLFVKGAIFLLRDAFLNEYPATNVRWIGKGKLVGDFTLGGVPVGTHDVVVRNPDGQEAVLSNGFVVDAPVPVLVQAFDAHMVREGVELSWSLSADEPINGFRILRENTAGGRIDVLNDGRDLPPSIERYLDTEIAGGVTYRYTLVVRTAAGADIQSQPALVSAPQLAEALYQNHPNPFNPSTTIRYSIKSTAPVSLQIYAPTGQLVRTLVNEVQDPRVAGYEVVWDGHNNQGSQVGSGVYLYKLTVGNRFSATRKLLLLK